MLQLRRLCLALLFSTQAVAAFVRPSPDDSIAALGPLQEESSVLQQLLKPTDDFSPITPPGPNDWLTFHHEPGQTFEAYVNSEANRPDAARHVIYLQPLGEFPEETSPALEQIRAYEAAYFQMEVKLLPAYYPHALEFSPRKNPRAGQRQILTRSIMDFLKTRLPDDAYCLLGITMDDLYPSASWNFVFGQASLGERVGVYSFARYDPAFAGEERTARTQEKIFQRGCKVLVHETAHMFGLHHCIYFDCVLNGSNNLDESDARPQHLCPVCLRKLHHAIGFDAVRRYETLAVFYRSQKWYEESDWVRRQLSRVTQPQSELAP